MAAKLNMAPIKAKYGLGDSAPDSVVAEWFYRQRQTARAGRGLPEETEEQFVSWYQSKYGGGDVAPTIANQVAPTGVSLREAGRNDVAAEYVAGIEKPTAFDFHQKPDSFDVIKRAVKDSIASATPSATSISPRAGLDNSAAEAVAGAAKIGGALVAPNSLKLDLKTQAQVPAMGPLRPGDPATETLTHTSTFSLNPIQTTLQVLDDWNRTHRAMLAWVAGKGGQRKTDAIRELMGYEVSSERELTRAAVEGVKRDAPLLRGAIEWKPFGEPKSYRDPGSGKMDQLWNYATTWGDLAPSAAGAPLEAAGQAFMFLLDPAMVGSIGAAGPRFVKRVVSGYYKRQAQMAAKGFVGAAARASATEKPLPVRDLVGPDIDTEAVDSILEATGRAPADAGRIQQTIEKMREVQRRNPRVNNFILGLNSDEAHRQVYRGRQATKLREQFLRDTQKVAEAGDDLPIEERMAAADPSGIMAQSFAEAQKEFTPEELADLEWISRHMLGKARKRTPPTGPKPKGATTPPEAAGGAPPAGQPNTPPKPKTPSGGQPAKTWTPGDGTIPTFSVNNPALTPEAMRIVERGAAAKKTPAAIVSDIQQAGGRHLDQLDRGGEEIGVPGATPAQIVDATIRAGQRNITYLQHPKLPRTLAGAKPRYGFGDVQLEVQWGSDIDRASYIAAQPKRSTRDADYVAWVRAVTGMSEEQVRAHGAVVKERLKAEAAKIAQKTPGYRGAYLLPDVFGGAITPAPVSVDDLRGMFSMGGLDEIGSRDEILDEVQRRFSVGRNEADLALQDYERDFAERLVQAEEDLAPKPALRDPAESATVPASDSPSQPATEPPGQPAADPLLAATQAVESVVGRLSGTVSDAVLGRMSAKVPDKILDAFKSEGTRGLAKLRKLWTASASAHSDGYFQAALETLNDFEAKVLTAPVREAVPEIPTPKDVQKRVAQNWEAERATAKKRLTDTGPPIATFTPVKKQSPDAISFWTAGGKKHMKIKGHEFFGDDATEIVFAEKPKTDGGKEVRWSLQWVTDGSGSTHRGPAGHDYLNSKGILIADKDRAAFERYDISKIGRPVLKQTPEQVDRARISEARKPIEQIKEARKRIAAKLPDKQARADAPPPPDQTGASAPPAAFSDEEAIASLKSIDPTTFWKMPPSYAPIQSNFDANFVPATGKAVRTTEAGLKNLIYKGEIPGKSITGTASAGEDVTDLTRRPSGKAPAFIVTMDENGSVASVWESKDGAWAPKADFEEQIYRAQLESGRMVDPEIISKYPGLRQDMIRFAKRRQVLNYKDVGRAEAPKLEIYDELENRYQAGVLGDLSENDFAVLDQIGGHGPYDVGTDIFDRDGVVKLASGQMRGADGTVFDVTYVVMNADDVDASHDTIGRWSRTYPKRMQKRDLGSLTVQTEQASWSSLKNYDPMDPLDPTRFAEHGPPILDRRARVINGNRRRDLIMRATEAGHGHVYREKMLQDLPRFGATSETVDKVRETMPNAHLYRVVTNPTSTWGELFQWTDELGLNSSGAVQAQEEMVADARRFAPHIGQMDIPDDMTLSQALHLPRNREAVGRMVDGIPHAERNNFVTYLTDEATGQKYLKFSDAGELRIKRAALGMVLTDLDVARSIGNHPSLLDGLFRSWPALNAVRKRVDAGELSELYDITDWVGAAADLLQWEKASGQPMRRAIYQTSMFSDGYPIASLNPRTLAGAELLLSAKNPTHLAKLMDEFAGMAKRDLSASGGLFGDAAVEVKDPVSVAVDILQRNIPNIDDRALGLHFETLLAPGKYNPADYNVAVTRKRVMDLVSEARDPDSVEHIRGSGDAGEMTPADGIAFENSIRALDEAAEAPMHGPLPDDQMGKMMGGEGSTPGEREAARVDVENLQAILDGKEAGLVYLSRPMPWDAFAHLPGYSWAAAEREALEGVPRVVDADILERLVDGDPTAAAHIDEMIARVDEVAQGKSPSAKKPLRAEDNGGPRKPKRPGADREMGANPMSVAQSIPMVGGFIQRHRNPVYAMVTKAGKRAVKHIQWAGAWKYDYDRAIASAMTPLFKGVAIGSEESGYMARVLQLRPKLFERIERQVSRASDEVDAVTRAINDTEAQRAVRGDDATDDLLLDLDARAEEAEAALRRAISNLEWHQEQRRLQETFERANPDKARSLAQNAAKVWDHMREGYRLATRAGVARTAELADAPMSDVVRRVAGVPDQWREGRIALPIDTIQHLKDGDMANPFMLPVDDVPGYAMDLVDTIRSYFPSVSRKGVIEPVLARYMRADGAEPTSELASMLRRQFGPAGGAKELRLSAPPGTRGMTLSEQSYIQHWIDSIRGMPVKVDEFVASDLMMKAQRYEKWADNSRLPGPLRSMLRKSGGWARESAAGRNPGLANAAKLDMAYVRGMLFGSLGFWAKNLSDSVRVVADVGATPFATAHRFFFSKGGQELMSDLNLTREFERFVTTSADHEDTLTNAFDYVTGGKGKAIAGLKAFVRSLNAPAVAIEHYNRGIAFFSGAADEMAKEGVTSFDEALEKGILKQVMEAGVDLAQKHHFVYGVFGRSPYVYRSPVKRILTTFTQYNYNQMELAAGWIKSMMTKNPNGAFLRYLLWTGYFTGLADRSGWDISNWFGAGGILPDPYSMSTAGPWPLKTPAVSGLEGLVQLLVGSGRGDKELAREGWDKVIRSTATTFIPAAVQIERTGKLIQAERDGQISNHRQIGLQPYNRTLRERLSVLSGLATTETSDRRKAMGLKKAEQAQTRLWLGDNMPKLADAYKRGFLDGDSDEAKKQFDALVAKGVKEGVSEKSIYTSLNYQMSFGTSEIPRWLNDIVAGDWADQNGAAKPQVIEGLKWMAKYSTKEEWSEWAKERLQEIAQSEMERLGASSPQPVR